MSASNEALFVGVDAHGSLSKPFFIATLSFNTKGNICLNGVERLNGVEKAVEFVLQTNPSVVAIDAPQPLCDKAHEVTFEEGFKACEWAKRGLRECERQLVKQFGIRCFPTTPTTFASFRQLILTGWKLYAELTRHNYRIADGMRSERHERWLIEVYPHATFSALSRVKLHPKTRLIGRMQRVNILKRYIPNLVKRLRKMPPCDDELDSIAAALTAYLWWRGECIILGSPHEGGCLVIPKGARDI